MNQLEKEDVVNRYGERISKLGPVVQALGWSSREQQELRFSVIKEAIDPDCSLSILDVGCGFGDLLGYLKRDFQEIDYTGCDLSPDVIEIANSSYPGVVFEVRDVLLDSYPDSSFDYVCMSGIFNYKIKDNNKYLSEMISTTYKLCKKAIIFNLVTDVVDYKDSHLFYYNPGDVFELCKNYTKSIVIRHDYPLYEFTVICKK